MSPSNAPPSRGIATGLVSDCRMLLAWGLAACALLPASAAAQPFEIVGTRAQGMGGAFVAVADDATAGYWNPAGLATGAIFDAQVEFGARESVGNPDRPVAPGERVSRGRVRSLAVGLPVVGLSYYRIDGMAAVLPPTTVAGSGIRETESGSGLRLERVVTRSFGVSLLQSLARIAVVGATVKVVSNAAAEAAGRDGGLPGPVLDEAGDLETAGRTRFDLDAGVMGSFGPVRVGLAVRNLCEPEVGGLAGAAVARLPRRVRLGVAYAPRSAASGVYGPLTVALDADLTATEAGGTARRDVAAGIERWVAGGRLGMRAGVRGSAVGPARTVGTAGVSVGVRPSAFVDGQLTRGGSDGEDGWSVGARVTF